MMGLTHHDGKDPGDPLREVAFLLAMGYLRLLAKGRKALEVPAKAEALCPPVDGRETAARKESA
jgi:hypothetical protein